MSISNALLERFVAQFAAFSGLDWSRLTERRRESVLERYNSLLDDSGMSFYCRAKCGAYAAERAARVGRVGGE
jgi:hypothetical protein